MKLGEFEYLMLAAAARLGDEAYGVSIRHKTRMGEATPQRGGRAKRMVRVTAKGMDAAADFYQAVNRVSRCFRLVA